MKPVRVIAECDACDGTGCLLIDGAPRGKKQIAILCARCEGAGAINLNYTAFTGLKKRADVAKVRRSGAFLFSKTPHEIPYGEFLKGKRP